MAGSNKPGFTPRIPPPRSPVNLLARQKLKDFLKGKSEARDRTFELKAGQVLTREGDSLAGQPALLVIDGSIEERITYFVHGNEGGQVTYTVKRVLEGQFARIQSLVPGYNEEPSICSIHVIEDGKALMIYQDSLRTLSQEAGPLLTETFRSQVELLDTLVQISSVTKGINVLLQKLRNTHPNLAGDPSAIINGLIKSLRENYELSRSDKRQKNEIAQLRKTLEAEGRSTADFQETARRQRGIIKNLDEQVRAARAELARKSSILEETSAKNQELWMYVRTLERKVEGLMNDVERLEADLQTLSQNDSTQASHELHSEILRMRETTAASKKAREESDHRLKQMQVAFEQLCKDNPRLVLSEDVMKLLTGEDPNITRPDSRRSGFLDDLDVVFDEAGDSLPPPPPTQNKRGGFPPPSRS